MYKKQENEEKIAAGRARFSLGAGLMYREGQVRGLRECRGVAERKNKEAVEGESREAVEGESREG